MSYLAKIFQNGRSQAVRIPAALRFDCEKVFVHRDKNTGDLILSKKPDSWQDYFKTLESIDTTGFMDDRKDTPAQERKIF